MGHSQKAHCLSGDKPAPLSSTPPRKWTKRARTHSFTASRGKHHPSTNILKKGQCDPFLRGGISERTSMLTSGVTFQDAIKDKSEIGCCKYLWG